MNQTSPFASFLPSNPQNPPAEAPPAKKEKAAKPAKAPAAPKVAKTKKPAKAKSSKPRMEKALKMDINAVLVAAAGLKEDESRMLLQVLKDLAGAKKKSRQKITEALGRLFK